MAFYLASNTCSVSMLGDSIIANMSAIKGSFAPPFDTHQNLGVSGETCSQIAARVGTISSTATHSVFEAGTNDLVGLNSESAIITGYTTMLNATTSKRAIVMGIPQCDEVALEAAHPGWSAFLNNARIYRMNQQIITLCRSYSNAVPALALMARSKVGRTTDGIHPTNAENVEMVRRMLPYLGL